MNFKSIFSKEFWVDVVVDAIKKLFFEVALSWVVPCRKCGTRRMFHPEANRWKFQHGWLPPKNGRFFEHAKNDV